MAAIPMDSLFPASTLRWTVVISAVLHALVVGALAFRIVQTEIVPVGVEVQYLEGHKGVEKVFVKAKPAVRVTATKEKGEIKAEPVAEAASEPAAQIAQGPAGQADGAVVSALERYKYELRLFLESRKIYPESAKRLRQTGTVIVEFKVSPSGQLSAVNLSQASSSEALNRAALDLVKRANQFKPFPSELQMPELQLQLPIEYVL